MSAGGTRVSKGTGVGRGRIVEEDEEVAKEKKLEWVIAVGAQAVNEIVIAGVKWCETE